jgi:hypothetical protein
VFDTSTLDALPTATILSRLIDLPESPWGDLRGKPITDRVLATVCGNTASSQRPFALETARPRATPGQT